MTITDGPETSFTDFDPKMVTTKPTPTPKTETEAETDGPHLAVDRYARLALGEAGRQALVLLGNGLVLAARRRAGFER